MNTKSKKDTISQRQQEILAFFQSRKFPEKELADIQQMLSDYYAEKTQKGLDEFVEQQGWKQQDLDRMDKAHIRTAGHARQPSLRPGRRSTYDK